MLCQPPLNSTRLPRCTYFTKHNFF